MPTFNATVHAQIVALYNEPIHITMRPNVTQADLARRLGFTQMTVSRALNNTGSLAPATRERILALAQRMGYRPNGMARRVQEGCYRGMALLGSSERPGYNIWIQEFHMAIGSALAARSWHLSEDWLPGQTLADPTVVAGLLDRLLADVVIVHDVGTQPPLVETMLEQHHVPTIWVNVGKQTDAVDFADADGAGAALDHLIAQGYRRPALLLYGAPGFSETHISVPERLRGYQEACARQRIKPKIICQNEPRATRAGSVAIIKAMLDSQDRPDAVLAYDWEKATLLRVLAGDRNLRIGRDLGMISFAHLGGGSFDQDYTICAQDYTRLGIEAVEMAWRRLETGRSQKRIVLPLEIVRPGASTTRG